MTKIYGYDTNIYETSIGNLKNMNEEDKIYPSMVIRSQAEAIELLEKENKKLQEEKDHYKHLYSEVKKQKDDVVEYIKSYNLPKDLGHFGEAPISIRELREILRMLGEIDD